MRWKKAVLLAALLLFGFYASTHMVAAGDTWVAMACGRHFANHGVDTVEPFSFNSHPAGPSDEQLESWPEWTHGIIRFWHPTGWINQNWLTHLKFYSLATWFGSQDDPNYNTLVYWKYALFIATIFVVFALGKVIGAGDFLSMVAACWAMVIGRSFFDIRPACYSNLLVPLFILLLALSAYKHHKYIWLMIPLIVFWANVHGGYIYAYMMMTPFVAVHVLLNLPRRWTISLGLSGLWMVLYLLYYKFHTNSYYLETARFAQADYEPMSLFSGMLLAAVALAAVSCALSAAGHRVSTALFTSFHVISGIVFPIVLLAGLRLDIPAGINPQFERILNHFLTSNIAGFLLLLLVALAVIIPAAVRKERFVRIPNKTLIHILAAGAVSFLAMIVFNPFRLTNLTHTFEISISEHAASWRTVNEWRPAFDWMDPTTDRPNPVGDQEPFAVMLIVGSVIIAVWIALHLLRPRARPVRKGPRHTGTSTVTATAGWPEIDLAMMLVGALTIYMAFASRRFIAIAAPSAWPVLALLVLQSWQMFTARANWKQLGNLRPSPVPMPWQKGAWLAAAIVLAGLGVYWGAKYYRIYHAPWPRDERRDSVFMRMTDSHQKPFEVCDFINDNNLSGRIFNYWTDGGALAFGQRPDPDTGKTPLQHFMDGRAQAAYDHDTFKLWQHVFSGGPIAQSIARQGRRPNNEQLHQIGEWLNEHLRGRQVWVALMPRTQADSTFMRALIAMPNWKTAFVDEMQHLIVDSESEQGRVLIDDILEGRAVFPDAFSKNLTLVRLSFETNDPRLTPHVFDYANAAFQERPYPSAMIALVQLAQHPMFHEKAEEAIRAYLEAFRADRETLARQGGYLHRLGSAAIAARYLAGAHPAERDALERFEQSLRIESQKIVRRFLW